jgi:hypothetical protein
MLHDCLSQFNPTHSLQPSQQYARPEALMRDTILLRCLVAVLVAVVFCESTAAATVCLSVCVFENNVVFQRSSAPSLHCSDLRVVTTLALITA